MAIEWTWQDVKIAQYMLDCVEHRKRAGLPVAPWGECKAGVCPLHTGCPVEPQLHGDKVLQRYQPVTAIMD